MIVIAYILRHITSASISIDNNGIVRFIQSREPGFSLMVNSDREYRDHLLAFESLSEEEKSKWKVEIEYPPGEF